MCRQHFILHTCRTKKASYTPKQETASTGWEWCDNAIDVGENLNGQPQPGDVKPIGNLQECTYANDNLEELETRGGTCPYYIGVIVAATVDPDGRSCKEHKAKKTEALSGEKKESVRLTVKPGKGAQGDGSSGASTARPVLPSSRGCGTDKPSSKKKSGPKGGNSRDQSPSDPRS